MDGRSSDLKKLAENDELLRVVADPTQRRRDALVQPRSLRQCQDGGTEAVSLESWHL